MTGPIRDIGQNVLLSAFETGSSSSSSYCHSLLLIAFLEGALITNVIYILCINGNNAVINNNHGRLPRPSREKNSSKFIANLGTSPQKTSPTLLYSDYKKLYLRCTQLQWAAIAQSVQRLATGWTVRGSSPGGVRDFPAPVQTDPRGLPSLLYNGYRVTPGVEAAGAWRWPPTTI